MKTEKKAIASTLVAKAHARVAEQGCSTWGVAEHLALLRYAAFEAAVQAGATKEVAEKVKAIIKAEFAKDSEVAYASNFQKLLVKSGELAESGEYE